MVDWPGRLAAVAFTSGCNLHCRYCHNPALATGQAEEAITQDIVLAHLVRRRAQLDGLLVSGGEPTIQPGFCAFLARVKREGFRVKLDTNGTRPELVGALLAAGVVDFLAVDLKAAPGAGAWLVGWGRPTSPLAHDGAWSWHSRRPGWNSSRRRGRRRAWPARRRFSGERGAPRRPQPRAASRSRRTAA